MTLTISKIEVENIRGIPNANLEPKSITIIRGANGTGKSSWIDAFRCVFDGGYDPLLVRNGEERASVRVTLSDGTTLQRVLDAKRCTSSITVKSADGEVIKSPQKYVESLADTLAYDPLDFIEYDHKQRAKLIEDLLRVELSTHELSAACLSQDWYLAHFDPRRNPFDNIKAIRDAAYERRREMNVRERQAQDTVETLRKDMPTLNEDSADFEGRNAAAQRKLQEVISAERIAQTELSEQYSASLERIEAWAREEHAKIDAAKNKKVAEAGAVKAEMIAELIAAHGPLVQEARAEAQSAAAALTEYNKAQGLRDHLAKMEIQSKEFGDESIRLSRAIENLDRLRLEKLKEIPLEGADMRNGVLYINNIGFDGLNTAQQMEVAIQVGALRAKDLPFMLIDGGERLDESRREDLCRAAKDAGFQVVIAERLESASTLMVETA